MDQKQAIADKLKEANNILVTVSNNPSVDQLASCIAVTLALNKMGKHATAVFSGEVPSTIEFLQPEKTIEKNTDSLRDFIIALDKSKADKLRYKVEDKVVKIFITPYRTSINEKDLDFSQGDFNVDVVLALGVHAQTDLDQAITSHGRILHDATVATINIKPGGELGTLNWLHQEASSLSELGVELVDAIDKQLIDGQMATAFLTGIVAETDRFSNEKTSPNTMSISAELMADGANQQLVATKLEAPAPLPPPQPEEHHDMAPSVAVSEEPPKADDGTLEITHDKRDSPSLSPALDFDEEKIDGASTPQIHIDEHGSLKNIEEIKDAQQETVKDTQAHSENPVDTSDAIKSSETPPEPFTGNAPQPVYEQKGTTDPIQHMGSAHMILQPPSTGQSDMAGGMADSLEAPSGAPQSFLPPMGSESGGTPPSYLPPASATTAAADSFIAPQQPSNAAGFPPVPATFSPPPSPMPTQPLPSPPSPLADTQTLTQLERGIGSPHATAPMPPVSLSPTPQTFSPPPPPTPVQPQVSAPPNEPTQDLQDIEDAREAVRQAIASQPAPEPIQALNPPQNVVPSTPSPVAPFPTNSPSPQVGQQGLVSPPGLEPATPTPMPGGMASFTPSVIQPNTSNSFPGGTLPPPGPPPMMPS